MPEDERLVELDLSYDERRMLFHGLVDWSGPAECTKSLALAIGFSGLDELEVEGRRIADAIYEGNALPVRDWTRALFSTEVIFASETIGTGTEWGVIQGGTDHYWMDVLRALQQKIPVSRSSLGP